MTSHLSTKRTTSVRKSSPLPLVPSPADCTRELSLFSPVRLQGSEESFQTLVHFTKTGTPEIPLYFFHEGLLAHASSPAPVDCSETDALSTSKGLNWAWPETLLLPRSTCMGPWRQKQMLRTHGTSEAIEDGRDRQTDMDPFTSPTDPH